MVQAFSVREIEVGSGVPSSVGHGAPRLYLDIDSLIFYVRQEGDSGWSPVDASIDGLTATVAELNILDGVTSTAAELNILDGVTSTAAELSLLSGVTAPPVQVAERDFTETANSGTYTATVDIPAGATVLDVIWRNTALWTAATSASLVVGDDDDPNGYIEATDVKAAPVADTNGAGAGMSSALSLGATIGVYKGGAGKYCAAAKTITATVTTVDDGSGTAGRSRLIVKYALPSSSAASKA